MSLLSEKDRGYLVETFEKQLQSPVKMILFTQEQDCQYCAETQQIVEEVASLSDQVSVQVLTFDPESTDVQELGIDKVPAIAVLQDGEVPVDYGIRFFGIPSGYEFTSLIEDILMVSSGNSGLDESTQSFLASLTEPLHLQVFITPT